MFLLPEPGGHFNFVCTGVCGHRIGKLTHPQTKAGPSINKNTPILRLLYTLYTIIYILGLLYILYTEIDQTTIGFIQFRIPFSGKITSKL